MRARTATQPAQGLVSLAATPAGIDLMSCHGIGWDGMGWDAFGLRDEVALGEGTRLRVEKGAGPVRSRRFSPEKMAECAGATTAGRIAHPPLPTYYKLGMRCGATRKAHEPQV